MIPEDAFYLLRKRKEQNLISSKDLNGDPRHFHDCRLLTRKQFKTKGNVDASDAHFMKRVLAVRRALSPLKHADMVPIMKAVHLTVDTSPTKSIVGYILFSLHLPHELHASRITRRRCLGYINYLANGMFISEKQKASIN